MKARNQVPSEWKHQYQYEDEDEVEDDPSFHLRVYQLWKGSNVQIFGPYVRSLVLTVFLIVAPGILFCAFVSPSLILQFPHNLGNLFVAISILFTFSLIILLFFTSGRDPGVIPRNQHPPQPEPELEEGHYGSTISSRDGPPTLPPTKDVVVKGHVVKVKYCQTCSLYRPPRRSHCSICNNCVERFDHHCPWVGQCIAQTTYENFRYRYDGKTNPYNRGCVRNFVEIFFSQIPRSKNNFRAKVKGDASSVFDTSMPLGHLRSPEMAKTSIEMEMGKRHAVAAEDFEDIESQMDGVGGLERCGPEPRHHTNWDHKANWEITPDIQMLAAEFGMGYGSMDRQKIIGRL